MKEKPGGWDEARQGTQLNDRGTAVQAECLSLISDISSQGTGGRKGLSVPETSNNCKQPGGIY